MSLFLGKDFVLTFQERPGDCLDPVRERLRKDKGRIRQLGADYLAYALLDAVVDAYFPAAWSNTARRSTRLDDEVSTQTARGGGHADPRPAERPAAAAPGDLAAARHGRGAWPASPTRWSPPKPGSSCATATTTWCRSSTWWRRSREMCSDLRDFYLSAVNNRMSEVMKVLTVIATTFIPLTLHHGALRDELQPEVSPWNMPELHWYYGYPVALAVMAVVTVADRLLLASRLAAVVAGKRVVQTVARAGGDSRRRGSARRRPRRRPHRRRESPPTRRQNRSSSPQTRPSSDQKSYHAPNPIFSSWVAKNWRWSLWPLK